MRLAEIAELAVDTARLLRSRGIRCSVAETIDAANALKYIDLNRREDVYAALKITLAKNLEAVRAFNEAFRDLVRDRSRDDEAFTKGESDLAFWDEMGEASSGGNQFVFRDERSASSGKKKTMISYSPSDMISRKRLNPPTPSEIVEGRRVVRRLRRRLALKEGRRLERDRRGELDIWRSIRTSYSTLGEMVKFVHMKRKKTKTKIVLFVDVSGSMDNYSDWLLKTMHTLCRYTHNVECFLFSTRLFRATEILARSSPEVAVEFMWRWADMWGSGTKIGYCLNKFLQRYGEMVDKYTTVIIISDGWDTGDPRLLRRSMAQLKERAGRIVWLNPYADKPGYRPLTIGMLTAIQYIDIFAGTSVLNDMPSFLKVFGRSFRPLRRGSKIGLSPRWLRQVYW